MLLDQTRKTKRDEVKVSKNVKDINERKKLKKTEKTRKKLLTNHWNSGTIVNVAENSTDTTKTI